MLLEVVTFVEITRAVAMVRGVRLELITIGWMFAEAAIALGAGILARSVLLTAFGFDSLIELLSGIVLWRRLSAEARGASIKDVERLETRTARISGVLLVLLCAYVLVTSAVGLLLEIKPSGSIVGIAVAAIAIVAMPLLALAKARANRTIRSVALRADVAETITCAYMAGITLAGLGASMLLGLWWVQYVAALALLIWLVPETREALSHDEHGEGEAPRDNGSTPPAGGS
ncbi:MAG: cation transporter [Candidatus Dormiibacterota bacterium]